MIHNWLEKLAGGGDVYRFQGNKKSEEKLILDCIFQ